jgi:hypothetical protein
VTDFYRMPEAVAEQPVEDKPKPKRRKKASQ